MSVSTKELFTAFFKGLAFAKGLNFGEKNRGMAEDRWITIHPWGMSQGEADTGEGKRYYQRIFINDETDEIEGGLGGKLNGTKISDMGENLRALREDKPLKMSDGQSSKTEEQEEVPKHVKEIDEKTERWKAAKARFKKRKEAEEVKAQKEAEEAKRKAEEEAQKPKDYVKEVTDFIKEREKENLTPHADHWGSMTKPVTSILDKEYYKKFKDRIGTVLSKLNGKNKWEEQAVKYLKDNMRSIIASYSDETQRKNSMWGMDRGDDLNPDERRSKERIEKQLTEIERYLKNPEDYEKRVADIPEQRKNILSDLDLRFKALTKLPNDRGTNTYLSKLSSITEKLRKTDQYDITPDVTPKDDKEWKHHDKWYPTSYLTGVEDIRDEALKLINSVDKNPKYADIIKNAKQGEFVDNRIKATEEQIERAKEKEENKQERIDRIKERANEMKKEGYAKANQGWEELHRIPFGQPNIIGRGDIYKRPTGLIDSGYRQVQRAEELEEKADLIGTKNEIRSDDPLAIQKLQEKVESSVGTQRAYYQKKLDRALKTQERANTGGGLKKETKLYKLDEDFDDGRIRFKFNGVPSPEVREVLKSRGFRWSPSNKAWQRQNTPNGVWSAKKVIEELKQYE